MAKNIKKSILDNAYSLLWRDGYREASVNNMVAAAGVSKGAFFHHFPSKQNLTDKVLAQYAAQEIFGALDHHMAEASSVKAGLLTWLQEYFERFEGAGFCGGCMAGNFALEIADHDEHTRERLKSFFLSWENKLCDYLRPEAERLAMEPRQLARLIIAGVQGGTLSMKVHKDRNRAVREFQALADMINVMMPA